MKLTEFLSQAQARFNVLCDHYLVKTSQPANQLQAAMTYTLSNGGKRLRPLLVYLAGHALNASWEQLDPAACAIELIHTYSLIHDDLPAMDNSDLRRGKPTCHKVFDDAIAILAGDALQPLAFEILATHAAPLTPQQRVNMIHTLAQASGAQGMVGGQVLDLAGTQTLTGLTQIYGLKTGALLAASVKLGAIAANMRDPFILSSLQNFAESLGLAFQIQDDVLDIEESSFTLGKPQGIDLLNQKITYASRVGLEQSREKITTLFSHALQSIEFLGAEGQLLRDFTSSLLQRKK